MIKYKIKFPKSKVSIELHWTKKSKKRHKIWVDRVFTLLTVCDYVYDKYEQY